MVDICAEQDPTFHEIKAMAQTLTPYAVESRYDDEFWPTLETLEQAALAAYEIQQFIMKRLSDELKKQ